MAINKAGVWRAITVTHECGHIYLRDSGGTVVNSGTVEASGTASGTKGGTVEVLGERVGLLGHSRIDVSGDAGGGTALIGGDYQGKNPSIPNAQRTVVGANATITADAVNSGNGGKVIVWSDNTTVFRGTITGKGGAQGGNGGVVPSLGKKKVIFCWSGQTKGRPRARGSTRFAAAHVHNS